MKQDGAHMKCEICNIIEKLGLDSSAHDLWFCPAAKSAPQKQPLRATLELLVLKAAVLHRFATEVLIPRLAHLAGAGVHCRRAYRHHYITLGL